MLEDICLCVVIFMNYESSVCCSFSQSASQVLYNFIFVCPSFNNTEFARFCQIHLRTGTASTLLYEFCTHLQII